MQKMTLKEQIKTAGLALYAGTCLGSFGLLLGFYDYNGAIFYDLYGAINSAVLFGAAGALSVIICKLWPDWLNK